MAVGIVALAAVLGAGCAAVPAAPLPPWLQPTAVAGAPSEAGSATPQTPTPQPRAQRCDIAGGDTALVNPAVVGLDVEQVQRAVGVAAQSGASSLRVYRHDCLVAKSLADTVTERMRLPLWSLTKGLVALVAGRAVTLGFAHLDDSIGKYLPNVDELHSRITIRHLLTQTSGLRFAWANDVTAGGVGNSVDYALALPFDHEPGSYFEYAQVTVSLLAAVVASAVGQPFAEFAQRNLFDPLGIADAEVAWATDAAGNTLGYAFAEATPVALGKIGSLLLRNGVFDGRQLISERFVQEMDAFTNLAKYANDPALVWTNDVGRKNAHASWQSDPNIDYPADVLESLARSATNGVRMNQYDLRLAIAALSRCLLTAKKEIAEPDPRKAAGFRRLHPDGNIPAESWFATILAVTEDADAASIMDYVASMSDVARPDIVRAIAAHSLSNSKLYRLPAAYSVDKDDSGNPLKRGER